MCLRMYSLLGGGVQNPQFEPVGVASSFCALGRIAWSGPFKIFGPSTNLQIGRRYRQVASWFISIKNNTGSMQMSMHKLSSHTILQNYPLWCCCHVMYKFLYPSTRVRTAPSVSVRVSVTFGVRPLRILICMCPFNSCRFGPAIPGVRHSGGPPSE